MIRAQPPFWPHLPSTSSTRQQSGGGGRSLNLSRLYCPDFTQTVPCPECPPLPSSALQPPAPTLTLLSCVVYTPTRPTSPFQNEFSLLLSLYLIVLDQAQQKAPPAVSWWLGDIWVPAPRWPEFPAGSYLTGSEMPSEWIRGPRLLRRMLLTWGSACCLGGEGGKILVWRWDCSSIYYIGASGPAQGLLPVLALGRRAVW